MSDTGLESIGGFYAMVNAYLNVARFMSDRATARLAAGGYDGARALMVEASAVFEHMLVEMRRANERRRENEAR